LQIIDIDSWEDFQEVVTPHFYREWLYRGQSNYAWNLESSLLRKIKRNTEIRYGSVTRNIIKENYETEIIAHFIKSSHLYLSSIPEKNNIFDWLSVMQHYGTPTRMLDFTFSPYVALFFALIDIQKEASVYCIKFKEVKKIYSKFFEDGEIDAENFLKGGKTDNEIFLMPYEPTFTNIRLQAQQGAFLIPNTLNYSHDELLNDCIVDDYVIKLIIKKNDVYKMLLELLKMNISYTNLFPGLDGFCKSFENIGIVPIKNLKSINEA